MFQKIKSLLHSGHSTEVYLEEHRVDENHAAKSAWGGIYTILGRVLNIISQVGSTIVLARLLEPDDFGLFAMMAAVASLTDSGLDGFGNPRCGRSKVAVDGR
jgi:hypothetical protein